MNKTSLLTQRILRFKDELFLTSYMIEDAEESGGLRGIFICRDKPDPTFLKRLYPRGYVMTKEKTFLKNQLPDVFTHASSGGVDFVLADARARYVRKYSRRFDNVKIIPKWVRQMNQLHSVWLEK